MYYSTLCLLSGGVSLTRDGGTHTQRDGIMSSATVQSLFLHHARPRILNRVRYLTRRFRDETRREDLEQEALCVGWYLWQRMLPESDGPHVLAVPLSRWAASRALHTRCGTGQTRSTDALNPQRVWLHGVPNEPIHLDNGPRQTGCRLSHDFAGREAEPHENAVIDLDWTAFLATLSPLSRRIIALRLEGMPTRAIAVVVGRDRGTVDARLRATLAHWRAFTQTDVAPRS